MILFIHVMNICFLYQVRKLNFLVEVRKADGKLETTNLVEKHKIEADKILLSKMNKDEF